MTQVVQAIYEDGVLRPLERLDLLEHQQVQVIVRSANGEQATENQSRRSDDPLEGIRVATGVRDLAEQFDDYRLGRRLP